MSFEQFPKPSPKEEEPLSGEDNVMTPEQMADLIGDKEPHKQEQKKEKSPREIANEGGILTPEQMADLIGEKDDKEKEKIKKDISGF